MNSASRLPLLVVSLTIAAFAACDLRRMDSKGTSSEAADPGRNAVAISQPMTTEVNSLDWLVRNSPLVFVGRLSGKRAETASRGLIVTRNHFDVENILVGASPQKTLTLTTLGGAVGDEEVTVSHTPEFVEGRTYVIFTDPARTTYNPITGDEHGVFLVVNSDVYTYAGRAVTGVQNGRIRLGSAVLERHPAANSLLAGASVTGNPTVGGAVISAEPSVTRTQQTMQLAEFAREVVAARR
jgi:hypothetical protein